MGPTPIHFTIWDTSYDIEGVTISSLEFDSDGYLLLGSRVSCRDVYNLDGKVSIHNANSYGGQTMVLSADENGYYSNLAGSIYNGDPWLSSSGSYGRVSSFTNPNGGIEWISTGGALKKNLLPDGVHVSPSGKFGEPAHPVSPAGYFAYTPVFNNTAEGIGGDVKMFNDCTCNEPLCPAGVSVENLVVCAGEPFDLSAEGIGLGAWTFSWSTLDGTPVDPNLYTVSNPDCGIEEIPFLLTATCQEDALQILVDTVFVQVVTDDIMPFVEIIEEPCRVDVLIDSSCTDFITVANKIPLLGPGDVGSVEVTLVQTTEVTCDSTTIILNYDCPCELGPVAGSSMVCRNTPAQFSVEEFLGATYQWDFGPNAVTGPTNASSVMVEWEWPGLRTITVSIDHGDCFLEETFDVLVTNDAGCCLNGSSMLPASDWETMLALNVQANPFQEVLDLSWNFPLEHSAELAITNLSGQIIHFQRMRPGTSNWSVDFRGQQSGVYFLQVRLADGTILRERVVKQ